MPLFRKKPVVIEAYEWTGKNSNEILSWSTRFRLDDPIFLSLNGKSLYINTLEGRMTAQIGDYIIKGVQDEFYPCKPDIFEATYESADEVCTCGKGDDAPAIVHAETCLCVDWISGNLEGSYE